MNPARTSMSVSTPASASTASTLRRSEQLRDLIEEHIVTGVLAPGTHLDEKALATQFGVSRTPVREALIQLASEGLVDIRPRRGAVVAVMTAQRLFEMFEVMAELESMCARLAARRMTPMDQATLLAAHQQCQQACAEQNPDDYYAHNEVFHRAIYNASHNEFLAEQALALHRRLRPFRRLQLRVEGRMRSSFSEHDAIVQALLSADSDSAAHRTRDHILVQGGRFADLMASFNR